MIVFSISGSAKSARSSRARRRRVVPAVRSRIPGARRARSAGSRSASAATAGGPGNIYIHLLSSRRRWRGSGRHAVAAADTQEITRVARASSSRAEMVGAQPSALHPISLAVSAEFRPPAPP
jgi:hypothetical protein